MDLAAKCLLEVVLGIGTFSGALACTVAYLNEDPRAWFFGAGAVIMFVCFIDISYKIREDINYYLRKIEKLGGE